MSEPSAYAVLTSRAVVQVAGPDWRGFLQGLLSQDVETLKPGEIRFAALLTPQGKLLFDLFVIGDAEGCRLDVAADRRAALVQRLTIYRLRAKVEITALDQTVAALWAGAAPEGWLADPRLAGLGFRGYGLPAPAGARQADEVSYHAHRLACGAPDPDGDCPSETTYPIEADFDLLNGIDFKKGCFVGQETTSRMKRRGTLKNRMAPIAFEGAAPAFGAEVMAGSLRAGEVLGGQDGRAMALLRLDRAAGGAPLTVDGRPVRVDWPAWLSIEPA